MLGRAPRVGLDGERAAARGSHPRAARPAASSPARILATCSRAEPNAATRVGRSLASPASRAVLRKDGPIFGQHPPQPRQKLLAVALDQMAHDVDDATTRPAAGGLAACSAVRRRASARAACPAPPPAGRSAALARSSRRSLERAHGAQRPRPGRAGPGSCRLTENQRTTPSRSSTTVAGRGTSSPLGPASRVHQSVAPRHREIAVADESDSPGAGPRRASGCARWDPERRPGSPHRPARPRTARLQVLGAPPRRTVTSSHGRRQDDRLLAAVVGQRRGPAGRVGQREVGRALAHAERRRRARHLRADEVEPRAADQQDARERRAPPRPASAGARARQREHRPAPSPRRTPRRSPPGGCGRRRPEEAARTATGAPSAIARLRTTSQVPTSSRHARCGRSPPRARSPSTCRSRPSARARASRRP